MSEVNKYAPISSTEKAEIKTYEMKGRVKWFNNSKGFGFIVPDGGGPDIHVHITTLLSSGLQTLLVGALVHIEAILNIKGFQVVRVLEVDNSNAVDPSTLPSTHALVSSESDWVRVTVKWFNRVRGFGFVTRGEGTLDIFIHMETLQRYGFSGIYVDQCLEVRYGRGQKGITVTEIRAR